MKKGFSRATPGPTINSFSPDCAEEAQREGDGNNILCVMEHLTINVNTYVRQNGPILFIGAALTHYYTSKREKSERRNASRPNTAVRPASATSGGQKISPIDKRPPFGKQEK